VTTIVGQALSRGRRSALAAAAGGALGNVAGMSLSLAGAGALLATSATGFAVLKWAGSAYLVGLGLVTIWGTLGRAGRPPAPRQAAARSFWGTFAVALLNPKTLVFFVAFVPAFISRDAPFVPQAALLVATFSAAVLITDTAYALAASSAAGVFRGSRFALWARRAGGGALIGAGLVTASLKAK
jgi:threonine/homoserine/homoserine lactone efflux protein